MLNICGHCQSQMHSKCLFSTTVRLQLLLAKTLHLQAYKTVNQLF